MEGLFHALAHIGKAVLHLHQVIKSFLTRSVSIGVTLRGARGRLAGNHTQALLEIKSRPLLINEGFLLDHELAGESLVDGDLLLELSIELFDKLVQLALASGGLIARVLLKLE